MTTTQQEHSDLVALRDPCPATSSARARACGGVADGLHWDIDWSRPPPWTVDLHAAGTAVVYRMVLHPRTRRPARDRFGHYLYVPMQHDLDRAR